MLQKCPSKGGNVYENLPLREYWRQLHTCSFLPFPTALPVSHLFALLACQSHAEFLPLTSWIMLPKEELKRRAFHTCPELVDPRMENLACL